MTVHQRELSEDDEQALSDSRNCFQISVLRRPGGMATCITLYIADATGGP